MAEIQRRATSSACAREQSKARCYAVCRDFLAPPHHPTRAAPVPAACRRASSGPVPPRRHHHAAWLSLDSTCLASRSPPFPPFKPPRSHPSSCSPSPLPSVSPASPPCRPLPGRFSPWPCTHRLFSAIVFVYPLVSRRSSHAFFYVHQPINFRPITHAQRVHPTISGGGDTKPRRRHRTSTAACRRLVLPAYSVADTTLPGHDADVRSAASSPAVTRACAQLLSLGKVCFTRWETASIPTGGVTLCRIVPSPGRCIGAVCTIIHISSTFITMYRHVSPALTITNLTGHTTLAHGRLPSAFAVAPTPCGTCARRGRRILSVTTPRACGYASSPSANDPTATVATSDGQRRGRTACGRSYRPSSTEAATSSRRAIT